jgi:hypothetical protein
MKNLAILLAIVFVACQKQDVLLKESISGEMIASNNTYDGMSENSLPVHTPKSISINSNVSGYYETLPALYSKTTKSYPLIIFIHGIGELGTGLSRLNCCGLPRHIKEGTFPSRFYVNGAYYSYIVISPQFLERPAAWHVQSVIDYAKSHYRIDASRIYVTGLSMGGGSTWDWAAVYGQKAAAIAPVCAGRQPTTTLANNVASKNLPIWSLNSADDAVVPIQWGRDWINWIDARNTTYASKTKLTVWYGLDHNSTWWKAFDPTTYVDGYNLYKWFLLFRRSAVTSSTTGVPVANAGKDQSIPVSWDHMPTVNATLSTDQDGWIKTFRWTKISGPSSYWFYNSAAAETKINGLVAGTYVFRVTVTDNSGKTDYDDVSIFMTKN